MDVHVHLPPALPLHVHLLPPALPPEELARRIHDSLPNALEAHHAVAGTALRLSSMDAAFQDEKASNAFSEDLVMGVPAKRPAWLIAVLVLALVGIGATVALVFLR